MCNAQFLFPCCFFCVDIAGKNILLCSPVLISNAALMVSCGDQICLWLKKTNGHKKEKRSKKQ